MLNRFCLALTALIAVWGAAGCTALEEKKLPNDNMTVAELVKRMQRASDPQGRRERAGSYLQRQEVITPRFLEADKEEFVEVKVAQPDRLKITTSEMTDKQSSPVTSIILNGKKGWLIDYQHRKVTDLSPKLMARYDEMFDIDTPQDERTLDNYKDIRLSRCRIGEKEYYKLSGKPKSVDFGTLYVYVDVNDYLPRIIRTSFLFTSPPIHYESKILRYALCDGVMMPMETLVVRNGQEIRTRIVDYILNPKFRRQEFEPRFFSSETQASK